MLPFLRNRGVLLRWLLLALAETAVALPWMLLLYTAEKAENWADALPGTWLLIVTFLAAGLWEAGDRDDNPRRRIYAMVAGTGLAYLLAYRALPPAMQTGLLSWNRAVAFVPVAAYLWYQGARGAIEGIEYGRIFSRFSGQFGAQLGGIIFLMMAGEAGNPQAQLLLYWSVFLLFGAGLSLLLVTRERALRADQAALGEKGAGNSATPMMTGVVIALMALTLLASRFLSVERILAALTALSVWLSPFANWLWQVAMLIVVRWISLLSPLIRFVAGAARRNNEEKMELGKPKEPEMEPMPDTGPGFDWTPYLKAAMLVGALLLLALWLYRLDRRRRAQQDDEEERVSLGFWRSLWADLKALLGLAARHAAPAAATVARVLGVDDPRDPRALFRRLQSWGSLKGRPRQIPETPNRYQQALAELHPEAGEPSAAVTAVYNQARYGRTPPREESVKAAREALEHLTNGSP